MHQNLWADIFVFFPSVYYLSKFKSETPRLNLLAFQEKAAKLDGGVMFGLLACFQC